MSAFGRFPDSKRELEHLSARAMLRGPKNPRTPEVSTSMATLFTKIIAGELPGRFVWKDEHTVAFLTIEPLKPGHTLVVPRQEVDHWLDLDPELRDHLFGVAQHVGRAIQHVFQPTKVGLTVVGIEVPHCHLHLSPIDAVADLDFAKADSNARPEDLDRTRDQLREGLRSLGHGEFVPAD